MEILFWALRKMNVAEASRLCFLFSVSRTEAGRLSHLAAQLGPGKFFWDGVVEAQLGHLVGELEEEQVGVCTTLAACGGLMV